MDIGARPRRRGRPRKTPNVDPPDPHKGSVLYPGKGECADPVNEDAILEEEGGGRVPGPEWGASVSFGHRRRQDVNLSEMGRRQKDKEDDLFTAQEYQHAQSKLTCIAGRWAMNPL